MTAPTNDDDDPGDGRTRRKLYRHPSDVARLVFTLIALGVLIVSAELSSTAIGSFTVDLIALFDGLPAALADGLVGLVQLLATLAPFVVLIVLVRYRQFELLVLMVLAGALAAAAMALLSGLVEQSVPISELGFDTVNSWFIGSQFPSSTYLAMLTAWLVTAAPWMTRSWRLTGWVLIGFCMLARILSSTEVPVRNLLMVAVGAAAGSAALVIFGAPRRRVNVDSVRSSLGRAGLETDRVVPLHERHRVPTFEAALTDGGRLFVKVLGRDQRDSDLLLRAWRGLTVKGVGTGYPAGSPKRAVDHEGLALAVFGPVASTPQAVAVIETPDEAVVLATTFVDGVRLDDCADVPDAALHDLWAQVARLQHRRMAHGNLNSSNILLDGDRVTLVDLARADLDADDGALGVDVAELLASLSLQIGVDRTIDVAAEDLPIESLKRAVPLLQHAVLTRETRAALDDDEGLLDALRDRAAATVGIDKVELAPVRRITVGGAVSLVGSLVLVAYLVNLATNWDQVWDAFTTANLLYAVPIIIMTISTYFSGAMSLLGAVTIDLAYMRTVAVMFGQSYLNRFTPANAGGMAMRVRYLQLNGLDTAVSASAIALTSAASGVAQVVTILVFLIWGGSSDRLSDFEIPDIGTIVIIILGVGLVATLILISRWGRSVIWPWVRSASSKIKDSIGELLQRPAKLAQLFGGALLGKLANVVSFWASLLAFGVDISFPKAGAIYIIATTIGAAVPTPGGVGGVEAALTAALISYGVDNATAAAVVLFFRTLTFWLPTIPGYGFFRYTQAKGIV